MYTTDKEASSVMAALIKSAFVFLTWCSLTGPTRSEGLSENLRNLTAIYNGNFDNLDEIREKTIKHDLIQVRFAPVLVSALNNKPAIFMEEAINGVSYRMYVAEFTEDSNGVFYLTPYNFTEPSQYRPGQYNIDDLSKLKFEDLQTNKGCKATIRFIDINVYAQVWPDCRHVASETNLVYTAVLTCNAYGFTSPYTARERFDLVPYVLERRGPRYPLVGASAGFVSPCGD